MPGGPGSFLFGAEEKKELMEVIESSHLFRYGSEDDPLFQRKVLQFEREFADYLGAAHCVATSSGTGALMCCLAALDIGPGDEVIVPGYTFIASISAILLSRAIPVLAEIDDSLTIDPAKIKNLISPRTKAIMPVHMLGNPCDMEPIMRIAREHNLHIIEDCCQAAGAMYRGKKVGTFGDINAFSLNVFKTISAGDGGAVVTQDARLFERAFGFHDQGHLPHRLGVEIGRRSIVGMNLRINELTGAVALAQVRKIETILGMLRDRKARLKSRLSHLENVAFRRINDPGECATLLTLLLPDKGSADRFAAGIGQKTLAHSGWHVYNNMEQILGKRIVGDYPCPYECPAYDNQIEYAAHMLPATDAILDRAVNISIGVVDKGLGAGFGINILSDDQAIDEAAAKIIEVANQAVGGKR